MEEDQRTRPAGIVTFLFTDVEGSTRLWERDRGAMWRAMARHNTILGEAIRTHGGHHFKTIGDAFQSAFADPAAAVAAAVSAQRAIAAEPWPETGPLRVRMALHRGDAEPDPNGDYLAPSLNRLARLLATGHGGQVLLSHAVREAVGDDLPPEVTVIPLGRHRLRDLLEPEAVWQLVIAGLPHTFPPLQSLEGFATNLPQQPTAIVGRDAAIAELGELLAADGPRLVTLTGPGGVGKTRLALAAAADFTDAFPDGVFFVALAGVEDAALLLSEIATVLGLRESGGLSLEENLLAWLRGKRLLLLLDNLEQMRPFASTAAAVARILEAVPTVRVLATSRAPLQIRAEREWPVAPLPIPGVTDGPAAVAASPAIALFVERARAARPSWRLTEHNASDVAEIVRLLDGLPLAIELAAARIRVLAPSGILSRLGGSLDLLAASGGDRPSRQQTLRATIAWSHNLLSAEHQTAFRRLGIFSGGFAFDAADAVFAASPDPTVDTLESIAVLVEQSLVRAEDDSRGDMRYRMLETVRAFALAELSSRGEAHSVHEAHARWAESLARDADRRLLGPESEVWLNHLEREHDNFRAAMSWAADDDPLGFGARLPEALCRFWELRGHYTEGRRWLTRALDRAADVAPRLRAGLLDGLGGIAWRQGDLAAATVALEESLRIWQAENEADKIISALTSLGTVMELRGDLDRAEMLQEEALALARDRGEPVRLAATLNNLALVVWNKGNLDRATFLMEESVAVKRRVGNKSGLALGLNNLAMLLHESGDLDGAIDLLGETLALDREFGNVAGIADSLGNLAELTAATDAPRSAALDAEALLLRRDLGDRLSMAFSLESIATTAGRAGFAADGALLFGAAERLRETIEAPMPPTEVERHQAGVGIVRSGLDEKDFARLWQEGRGLPLDDAVAEALRIAGEIAKKGPSAQEIRSAATTSQ